MQVEFVLEGTVELSDRPMTSSNPQTQAVVNVDRWLKGTGPDQIVITGFGGGGDCRAELPSTKSIFFVNGNPDLGIVELPFELFWDSVVPFDESIIQDIDDTKKN